MYLLKFYFKHDYNKCDTPETARNHTYDHALLFNIYKTSTKFPKQDTDKLNYQKYWILSNAWNPVVVLRANRHTSFRWMGTRMKDVDIDTQTDRPDGWTSQERLRARWFLGARRGAQKFIRLVLHPHILARSYLRPSLYTLHNDVYPAVPTGTIVPKVNI